MPRRRHPHAITTGANLSAMPPFVQPMLAQPVDVLPTGPEWGYEPKLDGHRTQIRKDGTSIDVRTRNNKRPLVDVRPIVTAAAKVKADQAIIDGELTALDESGVPSFQALQNRDTNYTIAFFAFDLLFLDGQMIASKPLSARHALLAKIIHGSGLYLCAPLPGDLQSISRAVKKMGLEGIVAKRLSSEYQSGDRSNDWRKKRFDKEQEFVIGGYRPGGRDSIESLLVGVYDGGELKFAAKVRSGLNKWNRGNLRKELQPLNAARCPFADLPTSSKRGKSMWDSGGVSAEEMDEIQWVRPRLLARIKFVEWTAQHRLRHPSFVGLRADKSPKDVVRET